MSHKQMLINGNLRRPANENGTQLLDVLSAGLNPLERNSVRALVAYATLNTGKPEEEIQRSLCSKFTATSIDHLDPRSFDDAIRFLVNMCEEDEEPMEGVEQ